MRHVFIELGYSKKGGSEMFVGFGTDQEIGDRPRTWRAQSVFPPSTAREIADLFNLYADMAEFADAND